VYIAHKSSGTPFLRGQVFRLAAAARRAPRSPVIGLLKVNCQVFQPTGLSALKGCSGTFVRDSKTMSKEATEHFHITVADCFTVAR